VLRCDLVTNILCDYQEDHILALALYNALRVRLRVLSASLEATTTEIILSC
jgi:hypothetical protein